MNLLRWFLDLIYLVRDPDIGWLLIFPVGLSAVVFLKKFKNHKINNNIFRLIKESTLKGTLIGGFSISIFLLIETINAVFIVIPLLLVCLLYCAATSLLLAAICNKFYKIDTRGRT